MTSTVESGVIWLSLTSRVWTTTVSPLSTVSTGSLPASHVKWTRSDGK
jgi:predicted AlkP superfamily pyrophosphatase or phosphodiesterase